MMHYQFQDTNVDAKKQQLTKIYLKKHNIYLLKNSQNFIACYQRSQTKLKAHDPEGIIEYYRCYKQLNKLLKQNQTILIRATMDNRTKLADCIYKMEKLTNSDKEFIKESGECVKMFQQSNIELYEQFYATAEKIAERNQNAKK